LTKWDEIIEGWSIMHIDELHNLYSSLNTIRMLENEIGRNIARMEVKLNVRVYKEEITRNT
jgi:hypothetical protein